MATKTTTPSKIERRSHHGEVRVDGESKKISGYAATYNDWYDIGYNVKERILPGAFDDVLDSPDVLALVNHERQNIPLGRSGAGTLRLKSDARGLHYEIDPPDSPAGQNATEAVRRGDLAESSFAFVPSEETWTMGENGAPDERTIVRFAELRDVSIVAEGANRNTDVALRSRDAARANTDAVKRAARAKRLWSLHTKGA